MNQSATLSALDLPSAASAAKEIISQSEVEQLLAQVESVGPSAQAAARRPYQPGRTRTYTAA